MFGYVKPYVPEMRVREHELYRAIYCGLCRSMGKVTGQLSRFTLSYDFAFLVAVRLIALGETPVADKGTCIAHPFKKRLYIKDCEPLRYSAAMSALLLEGKVADDIADEAGIKRIRGLMARPAVRGMLNRAKKKVSEVNAETEAEIHGSLGRLSSLEEAKCDSIDACAEEFGALTAEVFSAGLPEREARICREIGRGIGRFIYVADAADDLAEDVKKGRFNPIAALYGDGATENIDGKIKISRPVSEMINTALRLDLERCAAAAELLCDGAHPELAEVVRNVIYLGLPEVLRRIME